MFAENNPKAKRIQISSEHKYNEMIISFLINLNFK